MTKLWKRHLAGTFALLAVLAFCVTALVGCGQPAQTQDQDATEQQVAVDAAEPVEVSVASLKGPTSIGLVSFMDSATNGETHNSYDFTIAAAADEILPSVIQGEIDIALVPANVASVLYNRTEGAVSVIDINTLGVLYVVTGDESVAEFADLAGKTIYMTGKGATPEYAMNYLLEQAGIAGDVTLEFKSEPTEVVAALSQDAAAVGVLPQPFATAAGVKNEALKQVIDLTEVWDATVSDGSQLVTGVTIVRNEFAEEHPEAVAEFLAGQAASVEAANTDPAAVAQLVVDAGIIDNAAVAEKAIPSCHLVCIEGEEMQQALSGYLQTLFDADPSSVGGALPEADFYYGV